MEPGAGGAPAHDWLRPRLQALLREAERVGFDRERVVAAMIDIITAEPFDQATAPEAPAGHLAITPDSSAEQAAGLEFNAELEQNIRQQVEQDLPHGIGESLS